MGGLIGDGRVMDKQSDQFHGMNFPALRLRGLAEMMRLKTRNPATLGDTPTEAARIDEIEHAVAMQIRQLRRRRLACRLEISFRPVQGTRRVGLRNADVLT